MTEDERLCVSFVPRYLQRDFILFCYHPPSVPSSNLVSSPKQDTPLHQAAREGHVRAVEYLIQAGADVTIKDNYGVSD